ncbi:MAG: transposase [Candidatus Aureabacteria bacterium]|nr:transposase [Candidatus Auribacterota bacterium]
MPNHIHGILQIKCDDNNIYKNIQHKDAINRVSTGGITNKYNPMNQKSLSNVIRWYKGRVSYEIHKNHKNIHFNWQPRFYDHIIRDEQSLNKIREYIQNNPTNLEKDSEYLNTNRKY